MRRTKEDSEETRKNILSAAITVFSDKGVSNATIENIATKANVTRGAIYWHFNNKLEIFDTLYEELHNPFIATIVDDLNKNHPEPIEQLRDLCIRLLVELGDAPEKSAILRLFLQKCDYSGELSVYKDIHNTCKNEKIESFTKYFDKAKRQNKIPKTADSALLALSLSCYIKGIVTEYLDDEQDFNIKEQAPKLINAFFAVYL